MENKYRWETPADVGTCTSFKEAKKSLFEANNAAGRTNLHLKHKGKCQNEYIYQYQDVYDQFPWYSYIYVFYRGEKNE